MADLPSHTVEPAHEDLHATPASLDLVAGGVVDAELAALLSLLVEGRVPVIVAAESPSDAAIVVDAVLGFVGPGVQRVVVAGRDETFAWLPQATELGWRREPASAAPAVAMPPPVRPETGVIVVPRFGPGGPGETWGEVARILIRAASIGYGLVGSIAAASLEDVFASFGTAPVALTADERSRLGVVLVVDHPATPGDVPARVIAAHYVRPVARDEHGHVQRLGPAVLAARDPATDRLEHFGWGITPELARRVGRRAGDFELELDRRRDLLERMVAVRRPSDAPPGAALPPDSALAPH